MSVEELRRTTGQFLRHSHFSLPQELIDLIANVQDTMLVVDSTLNVTDIRDGSTKPLRLQVRSLQGTTDQSGSYVLSLSDLGDQDSMVDVSSPPPWETDQSGETFFSSISHDIRTPLNSLIGVLQLLSKTQLNPQQERYVEIAQSSGKNVLVVTDELVDLDADHYAAKSTSFSLHETLEECMREDAPRAINKNLQYSLSIKNSVPDDVFGDTKVVFYLLRSLVDNAVKHTETGSVSMSARCIGIENDCARIEVSVCDSGSGISENQLHKLQEFFSRTSTEKIPRDGCARLGLTLCQRFAQLYDITIDITSSATTGTEFVVTLPLRLDRKEKTDIDHIQTTLTGRRILAVDENHINLEYIQGIFEPYSIKVDQLSKGGDALEHLARAQADGRPYDLVLVDYCLDDMNGLELISKIAQNNAASNIPSQSIGKTKFVVLSTIDQIISAAEMKVRGISAALTKPIRSAEMLSTMGKIFYSEPNADTHTNTVIYCDAEPHSGSKTAMAPKADNEQKISYRVVPELELYRDQLLARDETNEPDSDANNNLDAPLILIVEDNPVNLLVAEETLLDAGYRVDVANNGEEALSRLERGGIDLVLMDCQMPVLDGFAATRRIRTLEREKGVLVPRQLPVVALTANATKGDREKCLASGMNDYIAKPFRPKALFAVLNQYIRSPLGQTDDAGDWPDTGTG